MEPFRHKCIYAAIDVSALALERPLLLKELQAKCVELYAPGIFKPVDPVTIFSYSQIEAVFRKMQGGGNMGMIILVPKIYKPIKACDLVFTGIPFKHTPDHAR